MARLTDPHSEVPLGLQLRHLALQLRDLGLLGLHLPMARKGMLRITRKRLHPIAQHRPVHTQIARGLRNTHPAFPNQPDSLKLVLSRKSPSLHDPPPVPSKHLILLSHKVAGYSGCLGC